MQYWWFTVGMLLFAVFMVSIPIAAAISDFKSKKLKKH
jgi:hypothetical protein